MSLLSQFYNCSGSGGGASPSQPTLPSGFSLTPDSWPALLTSDSVNLAGVSHSQKNRLGNGYTLYINNTENFGTSTITFGQSQNLSSYGSPPSFKFYGVYVGTVLKTNVHVGVLDMSECTIQSTSFGFSCSSVNTNVKTIKLGLFWGTGDFTWGASGQSSMEYFDVTNFGFVDQLSFVLNTSFTFKDGPATQANVDEIIIKFSDELDRLFAGATQAAPTITKLVLDLSSAAGNGGTGALSAAAAAARNNIIAIGGTVTL